MSRLHNNDEPIRRQFFVKVHGSGRLTGHDADRFFPELRSYFRGEFVRITVEGWPADVGRLRGWYFGGIIPDLLRVIMNAGNPVHPDSKEDRDQLHKELKERHIPPKLDEFGEVILVNGRPVHTTAGLGFEGWLDYLEKIKTDAWLIWGIDLVPRKGRRS